MAGKVVSGQSSPFEYMLFEGNAGEMRTVTVPSYETSPWVDPPSLKLRHRIGRGPFGDVWLATHHQSTDDYDKYHEVAVKMLSSVKEGDMKIIFDKLNSIFKKCQGMKSVCQLLGFSIINEKICIVMKFYEGSVGDKMAQLQGGKLPLLDVFRYSICLAQAVMSVHSKGILILNLKPSNFLLDESNRAILGDLGIPYLLLGASLSNPDMALRTGTPNYMAPEQWEPKVRGPISFETDSWGFGCSILEMLTGIQPWCGRSVKQIYHAVVVNHERPLIPNGLPSAVKNVLSGCFEYDFRNRPQMTDIIEAFQSSQDELTGEALNIVLENTIIHSQPAQNRCYTEWFLSKDHLQEGDIVRSRKLLNCCKTKNMAVPEGKVVGLEGRGKQSGFVLVRVHGFLDPLRVHTSTLERVTNGFAAGDWVCLIEEQKQHSPLGIIHSIDRNGNVTVGFMGIETLWKGKFSDIQLAEAYYVGQFVRLKPNIINPRFEWPHKEGQKSAVGKIAEIYPNGCLVVNFPGRLPFGERQTSYLADPAEVELVSFSTSPGLLQKYQHLEDIHWAVRPMVIALGLFTAMKFGLFVGKKVRGSNRGKKHHHGNAVSKDKSRASGSGKSSGSGFLPWRI